MQADVAKEDRLNHELDVVARLAPGVSIEAADRELQAIAAQIAPSMPAGERGWRTRLVPLAEDIVGDSLRRTLVVLLGAVGLLLLVACANLSNLLLVRATGARLRSRRAAARSASRAARAIAQLLVESLVVTAAGGALGILFASWSVDALRTLPIARVAEIAVDLRVLAVAIAGDRRSPASSPASARRIRASQVAPQEALQSQAVRLAPRSRLRDGMIVAQLGLSLTLLVGAALVARSFWGLLSVDPGFSVDHAVTMAMRPSMEAAPFYEAVGARVRALPGVEYAGFISTLPLGPGGNTSNNVFAAGPSRLGAGQSIQASWRLVDGGYFEAMRIPLLRGRTFDGLAPDEARRSLVLSASLAKALFGDDDPVGREVDPGGNNRLLRVIGVVGDVRNRRLAADPLPAFYWSFHRFTYGPMRLVVKSQLPTEQIVAAVRREVRAVDPGAPIFQVWTLDEVRAESLSEERLLLRDAVGVRRRPRCSSPRSAPTASCRSPCSSGRASSASASRSAPTPPVSARWCCARRCDWSWPAPPSASPARSSPAASSRRCSSAFALLLDGLGTYGVVAFAVQRGRASSASGSPSAPMPPASARWCCARPGLILAGAVLGLAGALVAGRVVETLLFGVTPFDVASYAAATAALALAVLGAAWWPPAAPPASARSSH